MGPRRLKVAVAPRDCGRLGGPDSRVGVRGCWPGRCDQSPEELRLMGGVLLDDLLWDCE